MTLLAKSTQSIRKRKFGNELYSIPKTLVFAHKFSSDSSVLDLTNLTKPDEVEFQSWVNPSSAELSKAHISAKKANIYLQYVSSSARLIPFVSYDIASDMVINLKGSGTASAGDIIIGWIDNFVGNAKAIDGYSIVKTGTILAGGTNVVTPLPFNYNLYSDQQIGDVLFFLDGQLIFRCESNLITNDGEYIEVAPTSGTLTNSLQLKTAVGVDTPFVVLSNGLIAFAPTEQYLAFVQTLGNQLDTVISDLASITGNPLSRYQGLPNQPDLSVFGNKVNAFTQETFANCVVGSSTQVSLGKATHTNLQAAVDSCPTDGKVFILEGSYSGNLIINKRIMVEGKGRGSDISGTVTLQSGFTLGLIKNLRFGDDLTFDSGCNNTIVSDCFQASGKDVTDNGSGNLWTIVGE